jgi:triosephosphate isomerase (TIM)
MLLYLPEIFCMPQKIVAGNWKMNSNMPEALALASELMAGISQVKSKVVVCPPFPFLDPLAKLMQGSGIGIGAQNCASFDKGAFTGEVSAGMIASVGANYVIIGHSERRILFGETDSTIKQKIVQALNHHLVVIFCCGETLQERESGRLEEVISRQIADGLPEVIENPSASLILAYEPVWAIGTGKTASPAQAAEVHEFIRGLLVERFKEQGAEISILYGGSCNALNAAELFSQPNINGGLIGGASLKSNDFLAICQSFA